MFEEYKVVIWGNGKFQQDFQYIFEDIIPAYYVVDNSEYPIGGGVYPAAELREDPDRDRMMIIICDFDQVSAGNTLVKMGFEHGKSFLYADEIFAVLDEIPKLNINNRKLAFWGTGTELSYFRDKVSLDNDVYIDGNINKRGVVIDGKEVLYSGDIQDWEHYFIVITTMKYYPEISEILRQKGLHEDSDYIYYRKLLPAEQKLSEMLKKTIYAKPIQAPACARPFQFMEIAFGGNCYCCCTAWVDKIGNINTDTCDNIWHSTAAKIFRLSIVNKTFCFCKWDICVYIDNNPKEDLSGERYTDIELKPQPETLLIGIDGRCNLKCRQCRNHFWDYDDLEKNMISCQKYRIMDSKWMEHAKHLVFASYGEVFFSPIYKSLLFETEGSCKRKEIGIISNGVLFTEEYFQMLKERYHKISSVSISVDAACEKTYSIVRGGNWKKLTENLVNLASHRRTGEIESIKLTFCTQMCNISEIYDFIEYARKLGVDRVVFQKIHCSEGMTMEEFQEIFSITDTKNILKEEAAKVLANADLNDTLVDWYQLYEYILYAKKIRQKEE